MGLWGAETDTSTHYAGSQTTSSYTTASAMSASDSSSTVISDPLPRPLRKQVLLQGHSAGSESSHDGRTAPQNPTSHHEEQSQGGPPIQPPAGLGVQRTCEWFWVLESLTISVSSRDGNYAVSLCNTSSS